jgi:hypothetical protein
MKFVLTLFVLSIATLSSVTPSESKSSAKDLNDLKKELLEVINANKGLPMTDLVPLMQNQVEASIQSIKKAETAVTKDDLEKIVQEILSEIPSDCTIRSGSNVDKFTRGLTAHLMKSFGM